MPEQLTSFRQFADLFRKQFFQLPLGVAQLLGDALLFFNLLLQQAAGPAGAPGPQAILSEAKLAALRQRKQRVARRFIDVEMAKVRLNAELIATGDRTPLEEYALIAGPVPAKD